MTIVGLSGTAAGSLMLAMLPAMPGIAGYIAPIVVITAGYALFQAANNTAVMADVRPDQRGAMSGVLGLSRNLGLITGASVMGASSRSPRERAMSRPPARRKLLPECGSRSQSRPG